MKDFGLSGSLRNKKYKELLPRTVLCFVSIILSLSDKETYNKINTKLMLRIYFDLSKLSRSNLKVLLALLFFIGYYIIRCNLEIDFKD